jgi:NAD-dependent SIR2 family protein deacetylase
MPSYTVYCDECDAGYDVQIEENEIHDRPSNCSYCGSELKEENVTSEEDDWESLSEDEWEDDDDSRY